MRFWVSPPKAQTAPGGGRSPRPQAHAALPEPNEANYDEDIVMDDDESLSANRYALLNRIADVLSGIADHA